LSLPGKATFRKGSSSRNKTRNLIGGCLIGVGGSHYRAQSSPLLLIYFHERSSSLTLKDCLFFTEYIYIKKKSKNPNQKSLNLSMYLMRQMQSLCNNPIYHPPKQRDYSRGIWDILSTFKFNWWNIYIYIWDNRSK
jgi:hypothetical protein